MRTLPENPMPYDAKKHLAWLIVSQYHGDDAADRAAHAWDRRVAGLDPVDIPNVELSAEKLDADGCIAAPALLKELGLEPSTSRARAVIKQGGFNIGEARLRIVDPGYLVYVYDGLVVRVGKNRIVEIRLKEVAG